jgi:hypothetical protein
MPLPSKKTPCRHGSKPGRGLCRAAAAVSALAAGSLAQEPSRFIGLTRGVPYVAQQSPRDCLGLTCDAGPIFGQPNLNPFAGGAAFDMNLGGLWVSNGTLVALMDPETCRPLCVPFPAPVEGMVSGIAVNERAGLVFVSTTSNLIYAFQDQCPWPPAAPCQVPFPAGFVVGGLACNDRDSTLLIAASNPALPGSGSLAVARAGAPCAVLCRVPVGQCNGQQLGPIVGCAFDPCIEACYVTDGLRTSSFLRRSDCVFEHGGCCETLDLPTPDRLTGLCVRPRRAVRIGQPCTSAPCAACVPVHGAETTAFPGNGRYALTLTNAPAGSVGFLALALTACLSTGFPISCSTFHALPTLVFLGPTPMGGNTGCTGAGRVTVGIPLDYALCGVELASQFYLLCPGAGDGLSNCLTSTVTGS